MFNVLGELFAKTLDFEFLMFLVCIVCEGVDADTTSGHEIAGNLQIFRVHKCNEVLHDDVHAVFVKIPMVTEGEEV